MASYRWLCLDSWPAQIQEPLCPATRPIAHRDVHQLSTKLLKLCPANNDTQANDNTNELFQDLSRIGTWQWIIDWPAGGEQSNVYAYYFSRYPAGDESSSAYHGSKLWHVFNSIPYFDYSDMT
ncbi:uncharacterized protein PAC_17445 [Phialocephala subalpina]|uniref:Uncharacterized protein n=1 Tax=Phialocephala subalpina TaxID=576137 RepID=A0A1L7XR73_9HELO|nr:uncharacterized protein PAC_17445 [Phialocephala subalpina]